MPILHLSILFIMFFLSGIAGLLYQIMWMKELSLLFGGTTQSAAVTTASFFLGLGLGARYIGVWLKRRFPVLKISNTSHFRIYLGIYAMLEIAIALSALVYFALYPAFNGIYGALFTGLQTNPALLLGIKLALALPLLAIPAFFMGGTLPVMAELVVDSSGVFARRVSSIYFINTLGACIGAIAGGFWLPKAYGFDATYFVAMGVSISLAIIALLFRQKVPAAPLSSGGRTESLSQKSKTKKATTTRPLPRYIALVAMWSGFASLALQVLWTRLFSQVLQNSTYTYSAILVVFLFALSLGAYLANILAKGKQSQLLLAAIMLLSALSIALTPFAYMQFTHNMSYLGGSSGLAEYLFDTIGLVAMTIGPAVLIMGVCLPYLYKLVEQHAKDHYSEVVGKLNGLNTFAAIAGSLAAGFVLFRWLGTWQSIYVIALCYMLFSVLLLSQLAKTLSVKTWYAVGTISVCVILLSPNHLAVVPVDPINKKERLLQVWESSAGTVAVVEKDGNLKTKLNNWYALGGSKAAQMEAMQTHLPMILHGQAKSTFYLGLGTGVTSGTVLNYPVSSVVVAELVDEVITASKQYFSEFNNGLFNDKRVTVVNEDGRHYLQATKETFDLIVADLFIPWRAGVGNVYTQEHYGSALKRLNEQGLYVQWLPMYQLSEVEFGVIARTMNEVFPRVTVWRGDFFASKPVMALIGHQSDRQLKDHLAFRQASINTLNNYGTKGHVPLLSHYVGEINNNLEVVNGNPINTDNFPVIEYQAPESHRAEKKGTISWLTHEALLKLMHQMRGFDGDFLSELTEQELKAVYAGYFLHTARVAKELGDDGSHNQAMSQFNVLIQ